MFPLRFHSKPKNLQLEIKANDQLNEKRKRGKRQKDLLKTKNDKTLFILEKTAKNPANGASHELNQQDRIKYQVIVVSSNFTLYRLPQKPEKKKSRGRNALSKRMVNCPKEGR